MISSVQVPEWQMGLVLTDTLVPGLNKEPMVEQRNGWDLTKHNLPGATADKSLPKMCIERLNRKSSMKNQKVTVSTEKNQLPTIT